MCTRNLSHSSSSENDYIESDIEESRDFDNELTLEEDNLALLITMQVS